MGSADVSGDPVVGVVVSAAGDVVGGDDEFAEGVAGVVEAAFFLEHAGVGDEAGGERYDEEISLEAGGWEFDRECFDPSEPGVVWGGE